MVVWIYIEILLILFAFGLFYMLLVYLFTAGLVVTGITGINGGLIPTVGSLSVLPIFG